MYAILQSDRRDHRLFSPLIRIRVPLATCDEYTKLSSHFQALLTGLYLFVLQSFLLAASIAATASRMDSNAVKCIKLSCLATKIDNALLVRDEVLYNA
jgi:hypothetical protein